MYTARPELGTKRSCVRCAVRFYDLLRMPPHCPACGAEQPPPAPRSRPVPRAAPARWGTRPGPRPEVVAEVAEDTGVPLLEVADEEDDDDEAEVDAADTAGEEDEAE